ncbi:MAG: SAM-dependent methyltransferase, partial [Streptosporangiaceae bacterium]
GIWLVTYDGDWRETFRPDIPSVARIYDYLLGGKDNYPADRAVGESMIAQLPNVRQAVQWNRAFLRRVVRYLIREAGIRQIIDIGAGLAGIISRLLAPFPAGSHVAISHATPDEVPAVNDVEGVFDEATTRAHVRSRTEIRKLVAGMDIVEPGLAWPPEWRPDPGEEVPANAAESYYCVVVARTT